MDHKILDMTSGSTAGLDVHCGELILRCSTSTKADGRDATASPIATARTNWLDVLESRRPRIIAEMLAECIGTFIYVWAGVVSTHNESLPRAEQNDRWIMSCTPDRIRAGTLPRDAQCPKAGEHTNATG